MGGANQASPGRVAIVWLTVTLALQVALAGAARASTATLLGEAYRKLEGGEFTSANKLARRVLLRTSQNSDYALYIAGQSSFLAGDYRAAEKDFLALSQVRGSRFQTVARFRYADSLWAQERWQDARAAYGELPRDGVPNIDAAVVDFRLALALSRSDSKAGIVALQQFRRIHPDHVFDSEASAELYRLGGDEAEAMSAEDRIARAQQLTRNKKWHQAIAELGQIGTLPAELDYQRKFWTAMTLFKMRRQYKVAGDLFLSIYNMMGSQAAEALFHGARALSRADFDKEAIGWYQRLVALYPRSSWAAEAQFLSGWLEFNLGNYRGAIPHLMETHRRFARSQFAEAALWYLGFSHFLLGEHTQALESFDKLVLSTDKEVGGKGQYWRARSFEALGQNDKSVTEYRALISRFPFSWYALLATSQLVARGVSIGPFGDREPPPLEPLTLPARFGNVIARDPLLRRAEELIDAKLGVEAGFELHRGERSYLQRHRSRKSEALAALLRSYGKAGNFNRPWMLAVVHGGERALNAEPTGKARGWWQQAYPLAYQDLVEKHRHRGGAPLYYLNAIMRKESGFDPHTHSFADAQGLLQMIPPTTVRVARAMALPYTEDMLFDPETNITVGSWYIGRLLHKFGRQIPIGAGAYNSGPVAVMRWLKKNGDQPMDVFVELVSYTETRNYMKRVTENFARYVYLYGNQRYQQPLDVDPNYVDNDIDY